MKLPSWGRIGVWSAVILLLVFLSAQVISVRLVDLDFLLARAARDDTVSQSAGLIGKYQLALRRQRNGESELETYRLEAQLAALSSGDQFAPLVDEARSSLGQQPARLAVDALRVSLGKEMIRPFDESGMLAEIEQAYAWQRFRRYDRAIELYDQILFDTALSKDLRATVLLHQAYSMSLVSRQDEALAQYERIQSQFPLTASAETAARLQELLERLMILGADADASLLDQGVDSYSRMDYEQSIEELSAFLTAPDSAGHESEARYFLGRSYEETGQASDAAEEYERVIWVDPESEWAENAARRLTLMQEFYGGTVALSDYTLDRIEHHAGGEFDETISLYRRLVRDADVQAQVRAQVQAESAAGASTPALASPELWVRSVPAAAEVWIRGKQVGQTPLVITGLGAGPLELEVRHSGVREARVLEIPDHGRASLFVEFPIEEDRVQMRLASATVTPARESRPPIITAPEPAEETTSTVAESETRDPPQPAEPQPSGVVSGPPPEPPVDPEEANVQRELARAREETRIQNSLVSLQYMLMESERVSDEDVASAHAFYETIDSAEYPVLSSAAALLAEQYDVRKAHEERLDSRIALLRSVELEMQDEYIELVDTSRARRRVSTTGFVVGGIGAAGATASLWLSERATLAIESSTDPSDIATFQDQSGQYQIATAVSATMGGVGLLTGIITRFFLEDEEPLRRDILSVREQIRALEAQYGYPQHFGP
ncbi:MAG: tetratricopeptide repeat protein [Spirochaetales bacterium]